MKYFILLILPLLFAQTACNGVGNGYSFKGTISGAANLQTVLEKAEFDRSIKELGRVSCDGEGNFAFDLKEAYEPGLYVLTVGAKKMYFILDGKEKQISVKGELNTIDRLQVTFEGSETAACYTKFVQGLYNSKFGTSDQVKEYINANTCNRIRAQFPVRLCSAVWRRLCTALLWAMPPLRRPFRKPVMTPPISFWARLRLTPLV